MIRCESHCFYDILERYHEAALNSFGVDAGPHDAGAALGFEVGKLDVQPGSQRRAGVRHAEAVIADIQKASLYLLHTWV